MIMAGIEWIADGIRRDCGWVRQLNSKSASRNMLIINLVCAHVIFVCHFCDKAPAIIQTSKEKNNHLKLKEVNIMKKLLAIILAAVTALALCIPAFAGAAQ